MHNTQQNTHPNGELFVNIQLEDYLVIDKINWRMQVTGYSLNYIGQDNGIAYFDYSDDSQYAVVYYDMNKNCFIKQIFTGYIVQGIIDGKYVGLSESVMPDPIMGADGDIINELARPITHYLIIGSIPEGEKMTVAKGNTMIIGKSDIQHVYNLPDFTRISVNGIYVYMITDDQYHRLTPGDDSWEMLANVSQIRKNNSGDLFTDELIAKDKHTFSVLFYENCGAGYYINGYHVD